MASLTAPPRATPLLRSPLAGQRPTMWAMQIGKRQIGPEAPVYVIAELGVNHDGSGARLVELVEAAAEAGADAVKFQLFRAELLMGLAARLAGYQAAAGERDPLGMLRRLELSAEAMGPAVRRARELGVHAIATVFSVELVDEAESLDLDAYKTASPDIVHRPLLKRLAGTGRPLIVSTGASTLEEVARAVGWLQAVPHGELPHPENMKVACSAGSLERPPHRLFRTARGRLALLQCVSCYPTRAEDAAIGGMVALAKIPGFEGPVGYSDHTVEVDTGAAAARLGACILEKHMTWCRSASGPDHGASLEPAEFRAYASLARDESVMRVWMGERAPAEHDRRWGAFEKHVLECERDVRRVSRQSVTAVRDLPAGHVLTREDMTFKRPGTGVEPWRLDEMLGRRLARSVSADMPLTDEDVA
jgi:N,N'-diacetyllegionaminate synthase